MTEENIGDQFSSMDRSILGEYGEYENYFNYLKRSFSYLIHSFNMRTADNPIEINIMQSFVQRFLNTIEALHSKYALENEHPLHIDLTDSSFPNFIEMKKVTADLYNKDEQLAALPSRQNIIQGALDHLFDRSEKPTRLLAQMGKRSYLEKLSPDRIFAEFIMGEIIELESTSDHSAKHYILPWASFDPLVNRPFIYILIFEKGGQKPPFEKKVLNLQEFKQELQKLTQNTAPLRVIAHDIDALNEVVKPKTLKRIDLGPLHGKYSMDENPLTKVVKEHFPNEFIFQFTSEMIFSVGEKKAKSFLSSGELRQVFFIDESSKKAMQRHVSKVLTYLIAPHSVAQYVNTNYKDLLEKHSMEIIAVN